MMKKLLLILGGLVLLLVGISATGYYYLVRMLLSKTDGELRVPGLHSPVPVFRSIVYFQSQHRFAGARSYCFAVRSRFQK